MRGRALVIAASLAGCLVSSAAALGAPPPQGFQSDAAFARSVATKGVVNVSATTQRVSC
jgi:hypothetical protein